MYSICYYWKDIIRKKLVNEKTVSKPKKFETRYNKEYKVKIIIKSLIYSKKTVNNQMLSFYYLIL